MNRRDFIRNMGWSVLTAAGMIIAAGSRERVYAAGKKGGRKSSSGNPPGSKSGGDARKSDVHGMDLGSGRFKTNSPTQKDKGLIYFGKDGL
jgi:hypothetical protein